MVLFSLVLFAVTTPANILFYAQQATGWIGDPEILKNMDPSDIRMLMRETLLSRETVIAVIWIMLAGTAINLFRVSAFAGATLFAAQTINQKASAK